MRPTQQSGTAVIEQDLARSAGRGALWGLTAAAAFVILACGAAPARAASYRLSQGLPSSDVQTAKTVASPDGRYVVYAHDAVIESARELWSVPVAGGAPVRLSGLLPAGTAVGEFAISPDGERVVYRAAQETAGKRELYSIPIAGPEGAWIRLNGPLPSAGTVRSFAISSDSTHVVYLADQQTDEVYDAWSVPIDGGTPIRLRPAAALPGSSATVDVTVEISPDGARVVFRANFSDLDTIDLWSARLDGVGEPTRINGALVSGGSVLNIRVSPDSSRVVYRADQQANATYTLHSVLLTGGGAVQLNGALVGGGEVVKSEISSDSTRVVYLADQQVDEVIELYSVPLAGGAAVKLNGALALNRTVNFAAISPNSARVVYTADQQTDDVFELYSVPLAGGVATKLNAQLPLGGNVYTAQVSPDSARVVYRADQHTDEVQELYSVPLAGGAKVRVSDALVAGGDVTPFFEIAPGSEFVYYSGDVVTDDLIELFRSRIDAYNVADPRVSGPMVAGGRALGECIPLANGRQAIYHADQEVDERIDLYVGDACLLCDGFEAGGAQRWD